MAGCDYEPVQPPENSLRSAVQLRRWWESGVDCGRRGLPGLADVVLATRSEVERRAYAEGLEKGRQDRAAGLTEPLNQQTESLPMPQPPNTPRG